MNILRAINKLRGSLRLESDPSIILTTKAIITGMTNYFFKKNFDWISKNVYICKSCEFNVAETDKSMIVEDTQYPELTGRMCGDCGGCTLSFKTRQNIKPCRLWEQSGN